MQPRKQTRMHPRRRNRQLAYLKLGGLGVLACLITLVAIFSLEHTGTASAQLQTTPGLYGPIGRLPSQIVGVPDIRPNRPADDPSFTTSDVVSYVATRPLAQTTSSSILGPSAVTVQFLTSQVVSSRLAGEPTGLPSNTLLCFVEVHGTFVFLGPSGLTPSFHTGYEVFDARTGNLLMWGGLP